MINIATCDDQFVIQQQVNQAIDKVMKEIQEEYTIDNFSCGEKLIDECKNKTNMYDIVFLDINITEDEEGFKIASTLRQMYGEKIIIIFMTGHSDYVFDCFEYNPLGFVRKERMDQEVDSILKKAIDTLQGKRDNVYIFKTSQGEIRLMPEDIYYVEKIGRKSFIFSKKGDFETSYSLAEVQDIIKSHDFIMIYRSIIVNLEYVLKIEKNCVILENNKQLPMSRHRVKEVKTAFSMYL